MTTDLEKQFFSTFRIEAIKYCKRCCWCKIEETTFGDYDRCLKPESGNCLCVYPQITDRHYLELIEILLNFEYIGFKKGKKHYSVDFQGWLEQRENSLKNAILKSLIVVANSEFKDVIYNQVQALFEEG